MDSIVAAVSAHARDAKERAAILFEGQTVTYGQLWLDVRRFAQGLRAWGLVPGDRVALFLENCPEFAVAYLGIHLAGGIVVLVNTQYRQVELSHILTDAGVCACVTEHEGAAELAPLALPDLRPIIPVGD